jgi:hypothetical protein
MPKTPQPNLIIHPKPVHVEVFLWLENWSPSQLCTTLSLVHNMTKIWIHVKTPLAEEENLATTCSAFASKVVNSIDHMIQEETQ